VLWPTRQGLPRTGWPRVARLAQFKPRYALTDALLDESSACRDTASRCPCARDERWCQFDHEARPAGSAAHRRLRPFIRRIRVHDRRHIQPCVLRAESPRCGPVLSTSSIGVRTPLSGVAQEDFAHAGDPLRRSIRTVVMGRLLDIISFRSALGSLHGLLFVDQAWSRRRRFRG